MSKLQTKIPYNPEDARDWVLDKRLESVLQDAIIDTSRMLGVYLLDIKLQYPPPVDDFVDPAVCDIRWIAKIESPRTEGMPEHARGWITLDRKEDIMTYELAKQMMSRSTAWSCTISMMNQRAMVVAALDAFRFAPEGSLLQAAYLAECLQVASGTLIKGQDPGVAKIQKGVLAELQRTTIERLTDFYDKMKKDADSTA